MPETKIRIAVILGTVRPGSYTGKAAALVTDELRKNPEITIDLIDPSTLQLPLPGQTLANSSAKALQATVSQATGVVLVGPEYHGSVSSALKLIIENLGFPSVLAGKPVAMLGVAAGAIGAIKSLEQLRSICSHIGCLVLPSAVSVANVQKVFTADGQCQDAATEKRVRGVGTALVEYIHKHVCPALHMERMAREQNG